MLTTESLRIGYDNGKTERVLFDNLNLKLRAGSLVCLMGPNGSGKSSLIRTLCGLQKSLGGHVRVNGERAEFDPKQIAVVLTDKLFAGSMTAYELISFGRYPYLDWRINLTSEDRDIIAHAIERVSVKDLLSKPLSQLSDGQLQMVMIARALAQDTPILLLDEPTAHLDLNNRLEVMKTLKRISTEFNKAILMATHELDLALQTADHVWLAGKDQQILTGIPEDLVMTNAFDEIFTFKGYDLKTGRVEHFAFRRLPVVLLGAGSEFLWTRNALERSGFNVISELTDSSQSIFTSVRIRFEESKPRWVVESNNRLYVLNTIADLIEQLISIDCE